MLHQQMVAPVRAALRRDVRSISGMTPMTRRLCVLSIVLLLGGCASPISTIKETSPDADQRRASMLGSWYGEELTKDGSQRLELVDRGEDGTLQVRFRIIEASGRTWEQTEVGLWGITGPVYFTITRGWLHGDKLELADPTDAGFYDAYRVLELTTERFRYRSYASGDVYTLRRVARDFTFPR